MNYFQKKEFSVETSDRFSPWICYDEKNRVIRLATRHTAYQMQVGDLGELLHLYYGPKVGDCSILGNISRRDVGFSPNPYDAGLDRTYSFDTLPLEYSALGNGDYRATAFEAKDGTGARAADFRVEKVEAYEGKYSIPGQPALFAKKEEAVTAVVHMKDQYSDLWVRLYYGILPKKDVITRAVCILNRTQDDMFIEKAYSFLIDLPADDWEMLHFAGRHTQERTPVEEKLTEGIKVIESHRGTSGHQHNPFLILKRGPVSEQEGWCIGASLVYSGSFKMEAEVDQTGGLRLTGGINPVRFSWKLGSGEEFFTPETVFAFTKSGLGRLSRIYHTVYRENLMRGPYVKNPRPILVNNWEATYFDFTKEKLLEIADKAAYIGLDMMVLDDGWFGKRDDDYSGLGDWTVNEKKLSGDIASFAREIRSRGLKFGLWIEPEMISEDSDLYREHPEWCLAVPGRKPVRSRHQLNLDIGRKEVRDYILEHIFEVLDSCRIDYIKWDMNRSIENVYSAALPADRQGEVLHRYVLGVYEMMEKLIGRYPDILFENCSGGGGRFDAGMLHYSPQIWCSDNTDAVERLMIQYGTSFGYPPSSMGAHVSVVPNHQTGRTVSLRTRETVAGAGTFGFELDLTQMSPRELERAAESVREYKKNEHFILEGDYYRLTDPRRGKNCFWQFVSGDAKEAVISGVCLYVHSNEPPDVVFPAGLNRSAVYRCSLTGEERTGAGWMYGGIMLPGQKEDYESFSFRLTQTKEGKRGCGGCCKKG